MPSASRAASRTTDSNLRNDTAPGSPTTRDTQRGSVTSTPRGCRGCRRCAGCACLYVMPVGVGAPAGGRRGCGGVRRVRRDRRASRQPGPPFTSRTDACCRSKPDPTTSGVGSRARPCGIARRTDAKCCSNPTRTATCVGSRAGAGLAGGCGRGPGAGRGRRASHVTRGPRADPLGQVTDARRPGPGRGAPVLGPGREVRGNLDPTVDSRDCPPRSWVFPPCHEA